MSIGRFAPDEDNINQYNTLAGTTGPTTSGAGPGGAGAGSPFAINAHVGKYDPNSDQQSADLWWDYGAGASNAFRETFGHVDPFNPFFNRFENQLAPGLAKIYEWMNPMGSVENQGAGWVPYAQDYLGRLTDSTKGNVFGASDLSNIFKSILTGSGAVTDNQQGFLAGASDKDIMGMLSGIMQTMGYTAGGPIAMKGMQNLFEMMMSEWRADAPLQSPGNAGNPFLNWISGSGWLDRLT